MDIHHSSKTAYSPGDRLERRTGLHITDKGAYHNQQYPKTYNEVGRSRTGEGSSGGWCEEWPGAAGTILLFHIISARPPKQPRMVRTFLKVLVLVLVYSVFSIQ